MNLKSLASGLTFRGEVEGQRQTYHVFEGRRYYFVMSFSRSKRNAGNFNIVDREGVEYVARRFSGEHAATAKQIAHASRKPRYVSTPLDALNILYVLVATGRATLDRRFRTKELHFNLRKQEAG